MKKKHLAVAMTFGSTLMLSACGGGGSSGISLTGTWVGTYDDWNLFYEMNTTINKTTIESLTIGGVALGTGSVTKVQGKVYEYTTASGGSGGFMVDGSGKHAAVLDMVGGLTPASANFGFAVVQKGATAVNNNFLQSDIVGTWKGYSVHLDAAGNIDLMDTSKATVNADYTFSGTSPGGDFVGMFTAGSSVGWWYGSYSNVTTGAWGNVSVYLSPDGKFGGSWACDYGSLPPSVDCSYNSWNRK